MSGKVSPRLVGIFVIAAIGLAIVGIAIFGSGRLFRKTYTFVSYFNQNVSGLGPGAPVKFRGVEVGRVREVELNIPGEVRPRSDISIPVVYELDAERIRSRGSTVPIGDPVYMDSLIDVFGLRAQLTLESLVTGRMYVSLDIAPEREGFYGAEGGPYREIPTMITGLEELRANLFKIVAEVGEIELDSLVTSVVGVVARVRELIDTPEVADAIGSLPGTLDQLDLTLTSARSMIAAVDTAVVPLRARLSETAERATATLAGLDSTVVGVRAVMEPGSPLIHRLEVALTDLAAASRALRSLAEYLERNPSAVLRGKPEDKP